MDTTGAVAEQVDEQPAEQAEPQPDGSGKQWYAHLWVWVLLASTGLLVTFVYWFVSGADAGAAGGCGGG